MYNIFPFPRGTWALKIEAGRCGLVVIASAYGMRTQARISPQMVVLIAMATVICILGHGQAVLMQRLGQLSLA